MPHHLINILDPTEKITAGRYAGLVYERIADIKARGRVPILCGGTGLYVRAIRLGLASLGDSDPELRRKILARIEDKGAEAVYADFAEIDPDYAATFHPTTSSAWPGPWRSWRPPASPPAGCEPGAEGRAGIWRSLLLL